MYVIVSTESSGVRTQWHAVGRTLADRAVFIRDWERQTVPLFSTALRPYSDKNRKPRQSNAAHPGCTRASGDPHSHATTRLHRSKCLLARTLALPTRVGADAAVLVL